MKKIIAIISILVLLACCTACNQEEEATTLTGMVVSIDGTVISLWEMDGSMEEMEFDGNMPSRPSNMEGFEGFEGFGNFSGEGFDGSFPDMGNFPQWDGEGAPELPDGATMPDFPEGEKPEDWNMEGFPFGGNGGSMPDFENASSDMETKEVDIANAHISIEIDGGKASGSLEDITPGSFVTITMNAKGEVTNVLISSASGFGGRKQNSEN